MGIYSNDIQEVKDYISQTKNKIEEYTQLYNKINNDIIPKLDDAKKVSEGAYNGIKRNYDGVNTNPIMNSAEIGGKIIGIKEKLTISLERISNKIEQLKIDLTNYNDTLENYERLDLENAEQN